MNTNSPNGWTYQISIPNSSLTGDTGFYTWTVSNNSGVQPRFVVGEFLYEQLGFEPNTTNVFTANTLTSINVVKFQLEDSVLFTQILHPTVLIMFSKKSLVYRILTIQISSMFVRMSKHMLNLFQQIKIMYISFNSQMKMEQR